MLLSTVLLSLALTLPALSQPEGSPILVILPTTDQLNLTRGGIGSLVFTVSNFGSATAYNVTVSVVASGCAQLLSEGSAWSFNTSLTLNSLEAGAARRALIPIRCLGGTGRIVISAHAANADPSLATVKVAAEEEVAPREWVIAAGLAALLAALSALYMRRRAEARKRKLRKKYARGQRGSGPSPKLK